MLTYSTQSQCYETVGFVADAPEYQSRIFASIQFYNF